MFVGKARSMPKCGASEMCLKWAGSGLTCKHLTRLLRFARNKSFSLLQKLVNYGQKSFIAFPRSQNYKTKFTLGIIFILNL
jgi:hypothetical protein